MKEHSKCKGQASDGLFPFLRRSGWPHSLVANKSTLATNWNQNPTKRHMNLNITNYNCFF